MSIVLATISGLFAIVLGAAPTIWPNELGPEGRMRTPFFVALGVWALLTVAAGGFAFAEAMESERRINELTEALREALRVRGTSSAGFQDNITEMDWGPGAQVLAIGFAVTGFAALRATRFVGLAIAVLWAIACAFYVFTISS